MNETFALVSFFQACQWVVAFLFVPLLCWYEWSRSTVFCRWCALLSGYLVQFGLIFMLDDAGFEMSAVILIGSVSAYAWIKLMTGWLPARQNISV
jgi:hypothetical protein